MPTVKVGVYFFWSSEEKVAPNERNSTSCRTRETGRECRERRGRGAAADMIVTVPVSDQGVRLPFALKSHRISSFSPAEEPLFTA